MGRIPVFVNTDCLLPLENQINWQNHCVWVESNDSKTIIERIQSFHRKLPESDFKKLQYSNRKLWVDKLTFHGFFK